MRPSEERAAKRELRSAISLLQQLEKLLLDVLARDAESSAADGFGSNSLGGSGSGRGSHADRTGSHATRLGPDDDVHASVVNITQTITLVCAAAKRAEARATRLTAHARRKRKTS